MKAFKRLDKPNAARILRALRDLAELDHPEARCKALSGPLTGLWRLHVGQWRVILDIRRNTLVIVVLDVGNRSDVYD